MSDEQTRYILRPWSRQTNEEAPVTLRVDDAWSYAGLDVVRIESASLALDVVPALGGKILHLVDKQADRNALWRHPRITPHPAPIQSNVDDHI
jgi:hypothetical protein